MSRNTSAVTAPQGWMGRSAGLSDRAIRLLREARWIGLCFLALFLLLVLVSFDPRDPGWSHAVVTRQTATSVRVYRRSSIQTLSCTPYCESAYKTEAERGSEKAMSTGH